MPEFVQGDLSPWNTINVHFECREDMEEFAKLVEQKVTFETRALWYPGHDRRKENMTRYADES